MIPATKPYFPNKINFDKTLDDMWETGWLTNNGKYVQSLEQKLTEYLEVPNLSILNNGTIALQIAIKALNLSGEIITTPFSYVATTSSIVWEGCKPVFVDIEESTYSINASLIEEAITPATSAILATHVFGNPCDVAAIEEIARKHNLKVIYDAAHAFGIKWNGRSILCYGDVSTLSFHATKLFHTIEGGSVTAADSKIAAIMEYQRRFGHNGPNAFHGIGVNGKLSEPHAAFGHCVLDDIELILAKRKEQWVYYQDQIKSLPVELLAIRPEAEYNYAYFPVRFETEETLLKVLQEMEQDEIFPRRYFYPSLNLLDYVTYKSCPVSESIAPRMLCLPLYHTLSRTDQDRIIQIVSQNI